MTAKFTKISKSDAPIPARNATVSKAVRERRAEYDGHVASALALPAETVGKLTPDDGESVRSVRLAFARAAKRAHASEKLHCYMDGSFVYVETVS